MSLRVRTENGPPIDVSTYSSPPVSYPKGKVCINGLVLSYEQFFTMVEYVLENTDLEPDDLRV
jgi:hypothetical protein